MVYRTTTRVPKLQPFRDHGNVSSHPTVKNLRYKPYTSRTSGPHSTQDYGTSSSKSRFSRYNGNQTDTGDIGLATAPAAACSPNVRGLRTTSFLLPAKFSIPHLVFGVTLNARHVHEEDVFKQVPLHRVFLPTKSTLRTAGAKAASPYEKATSQPHGCIPTRLSSVRDGTISLNDLTLLFGKLTVTPTHDPRHNFQPAEVPDLDQDVEMADAFEAPFEGYLRPAGLPTWLTDYGYSWYLKMLNHVGQDVEMVDAWDIDPKGCPRATSYYVPFEDYQKKSVVHIDWVSGPIFGFAHEVVRAFIQTSSWGSKVIGFLAAYGVLA
ncbi:hypothetical protein BU17DRAFT_69106 [Hysterangium stoloniferum]|nr:hypothetical protein BU17DRAFT_69106 [Hysterangium stoloniferum]